MYGKHFEWSKEDIFIVGVDDEDVVVANRLKEIGGGFVIAKENSFGMPLFEMVIG